MTKSMLCAALLLLSGCATQKAVYLPDGRQGQSINCSGTAMSWEQCYEKAGQACKSNGYEIISKEGDQGATIAGTQYGVFGGSVMTRVMLIACKQ